MMIDKWFSPKDPGDTETFTFGFDANLGPGETILTSTWTITLAEGVDADPSTMLSGGYTIFGPKVSHFVQGGIDGSIYLLKCTVNTSAGQTLSLAGYLLVRALPNDSCCC
jgi:hypothetical protein